MKRHVCSMLKEPSFTPTDALLKICCPFVLDLEGFDSVVSSTEKLSHPTTSRPKATGRRPPSQSLTSVSVSSLPKAGRQERLGPLAKGCAASGWLEDPLGEGGLWATLLAGSNWRVFWSQAVRPSFSSLCICQWGGDSLVPLSSSVLPRIFVWTWSEIGKGTKMSCFLTGKESKAGLVYKQKRTFEGKKG